MKNWFLSDSHFAKRKSNLGGKDNGISQYLLIHPVACLICQMEFPNFSKKTFQFGKNWKVLEYFGGFLRLFLEEEGGEEGADEVGGEVGGAGGAAQVHGPLGEFDCGAEGGDCGEEAPA